METLTITIKDPTKRDFLLTLLGELDFLEVRISEEIIHDEKELEITEGHSIFDSAGLFADRDIDAGELRTAAWKR